MSWHISTPMVGQVPAQAPSAYRAWRSQGGHGVPPPPPYELPQANPTPIAQPTEAWPFVLTGALIFAGGLIFAKGLRLF